MCSLVTPPLEPDGNGKCHHHHNGIFGGEFIASRDMLQRRPNAWYAKLASCWAEHFVPLVLAGSKEGKFAAGSWLGGELESQWHSIAGPLLLPKENFVRGYWQGMDKMCEAHIKFDEATGLVINVKAAFAASHSHARSAAT